MSEQSTVKPIEKLDPDVSWFLVREVRPGVWLISEPHHVHSYLAVGQDRAILIDSGIGVGDIGAVVRGITPLPVTVVNTHHHFDHVGGNWQFADTSIHRLGATKVATPVPDEWLVAYRARVAAKAESWASYQSLDSKNFELINAEHRPRPLPQGFSWDDWTIAPQPPTTLLEDGDVMDLGGRSIKIIHTPGHTPDSICLLDESDRSLFAGDTLVVGPHYAQLADSDFDDYRRSLDRLDSLSSEIDRVFVCHVLQHEASPELIRRVRATFHAVVDGTADAQTSKDLFGDVVVEHRHEHISVMTRELD